MLNHVMLSQNAIVNDLYQQGAWDGLLPVNIREVAQNLGYVVHVIDRERYPSSVGMAYSKDGVNYIGYYESLGDFDRDSIIGLELSRHLLGQVNADNDFMVLDDRTVLSAKDEETVAAKGMLFDFLMPDYALYVLVERKGISDITRLAKLLNVGETHLYEKLDNKYRMSQRQSLSC